MNRYEVKVPASFWKTLVVLKPKYSHAEYVEVVNAIKGCIDELGRTGMIEESGWDDHVLVHPPYSDGKHREAHTYDDDVLIVYFIRERNRRIRMVGVFDHENIPHS